MIIAELFSSSQHMTLYKSKNVINFKTIDRLLNYLLKKLLQFICMISVCNESILQVKHANQMWIV